MEWVKLVITAELETFVLNTLNPYLLISRTNVETFDFLLNRLFLDNHIGSNQWAFSHWLRKNFQASGWLFDLCKQYWLVEFLHFSGYQIKIKLIWRLTEIADEAFISICMMEDFTALIINRNYKKLVIN